MDSLELIISVYSFSFATMATILIWAMKRFIDNAKKIDDQIVKEIFEIKRLLDVINLNTENLTHRINLISDQVSKNEKMINNLRQRVAVMEQKK